MAVQYLIFQQVSLDLLWYVFLKFLFIISYTFINVTDKVEATFPLKKAKCDEQPNIIHLQYIVHVYNTHCTNMTIRE